jgi:hypothetical protein
MSYIELIEGKLLIANLVNCRKIMVYFGDNMRTKCNKRGPLGGEKERKR